MYKYLVYGLIDPRDNTIRYVGKSCTGIKTPKRHIRPSSLKSVSKKNSWIKHLLKQNLRPIIKILETCNNSEHVAKQEICWIAKTPNLKNMTIGGTGGQTSSGEKRMKKVYSYNLISRIYKEYKSIQETKNDGYSPNHVVQVCKETRHSHQKTVFSYQPFTKQQRLYSQYIKHILVTDLKLNKMYTFHGLLKLANHLKCHYQTIQKYINNKKIYNNRYKFANKPTIINI